MSKTAKDMDEFELFVETGIGLEEIVTLEKEGLFSTVVLTFEMSAIVEAIEDDGQRKANLRYACEDIVKSYKELEEEYGWPSGNNYQFFSEYAVPSIARIASGDIEGLLHARRRVMELNTQLNKEEEHDGWPMIAFIPAAAELAENLTNFIEICDKSSKATIDEINRLGMRYGTENPKGLELRKNKIRESL